MPTLLAHPESQDASTRESGVTLPRHCSPSKEGSTLSLRGLWRIAVLIGWGCAGALDAAAATRTLDLVTFAEPAGWTIEEKSGGTENHVILTRASTTNYCRVAIYPSTPASNNLDASFAAEWQAVALQSIDTVPTPSPTITTAGNARAAVGGASSKAQGQPVTAMLFVLDAGVKVVSVLVLTPSVAAFDAYFTEVQTLLNSLVVKRIAAAPQGPAPTNGGKLVVPAPTRILVVADLAGDWGRNDGITTTYVDRYTGSYAGTESLHFTEKWAITSTGGISLDFFGIRNGKKIAEKSTGVVTLSAAGILVIKMSNEQRYVLRGWLEGPNMTVMTLNGPWYETIPAEILANPQQGVNLDKNWVRMIKTK